jgi:membrane-associated protein
MDLLHTALDWFKHPDVHLNNLAGLHPVGVYVVLVLIVFCETGLVVWPFLPGDSLLFAVGALAASASSPLNLPLVIVLLCLAANCGDLLNYALGRAAGPRVFSRPSLLFNPDHLKEAQAFYERHGRKTIILARFVPIIRTFAPFVAGVGKMTFPRFVGFSVGGGVLWVSLMTLAGYLFGNIPQVKSHFEVVVLAIVFISVIPVAFHAVRSRRPPPVAEPVGGGDGSETRGV